MKLLFFISVFSFLACSFHAEAQSKKTKKQNDHPAAGYSNLPTSLAPNSTREAASAKKTKKTKSKKVTYDQQRDYYERVEAVAKAREKEAKIMEKPQYSDPMYFGHKRMPKKRPPHKMRFCKECGIRH